MNIVHAINKETLQDVINLAVGLFAPLQGFMTSSDYHSVADNMCLSNGEAWTIPISLDVPHDTYLAAAESKILSLHHNGKEVGHIEIEELFQVNLEQDIIKIFKTNDLAHPGVAWEMKRTQYRVGGKVILTDQQLTSDSLHPEKTKAFFHSKGWATVAGFQTRNPVHKAHEYLQRVALELCDGLFINPLVGWKKAGDFSEEAVVAGYKAMLQKYYFGLNVHFDTLKTPMRYAGPREAIFHALIRRNLGCTHFIIGRDHAGVGNYYGTYEAHDLARSITKDKDLGITLMLQKEPFYCHSCEQIVSGSTCACSDEFVEKISGTKIRAMLAEDERPSEIYMRREVSDSIIALKEKKFITE